MMMDDILAISAELVKAYELINTVVRELPKCTCIDAYRDRNLVDPTCIHCNAIEEDTYNKMVAFRDKFAHPDYRWMIN